MTTLQLTAQANTERLRAASNAMLADELYQLGYHGNDDGLGGWRDVEELSGDELFDKLLEYYSLYPENIPQDE